MLPFNEVPSNVPENVTSAGDPSSKMLMVKLNLSTLKYPVITEVVPRLLVTVPVMVPSFSIAKSAVDSSRSEEHTSELQSLTNLVCRLLLEKKKKFASRFVRL